LFPAYTFTYPSNQSGVWLGLDHQTEIHMAESEKINTTIQEKQYFAKKSPYCYIQYTKPPDLILILLYNGDNKDARAHTEEIKVLCLFRNTSLGLRQPIAFPIDYNVKFQ